MSTYIDYGPPNLSFGNPPSAKVGSNYSYQLATIYNGGVAGYPQMVATGLPPGLSLSSSGQIYGTPVSSGTYSVQVQATNAFGSDTVGASLVVNIGPPRIVAGQTITGKVGDPLSAVLSLSDPLSPVTSWTLSGTLQSGLSFNSATGRFSGTPYDWGVPGPPPFQNFLAPPNLYMTLSGPGGNGPQIAFDLVINFGKPDIVRGLAFSGVAGLYFDARYTWANNIKSRPIDTWEVTGLPSWAIFDAPSGSIRGTPSQQDVGRTTITLTATGDGGVDSTTAEIFIAAGPPIVAPNQQFLGKVGQAFSATPALTDSTNRPASAWSAAGLPAGLSLNTTTGAITGTPTAKGAFTATFTATGSGITGQAQSVAFTIADGVPLITAGQTALGTVGAAFSKTFSLTDTTNRPVTSWAATGLPPGLSLNSSTGAITGTPTTKGTFTPTLSATGPGGTGTATATITLAQYAEVSAAFAAVAGLDFSGYAGPSLFPTFNATAATEIQIVGSLSLDTAFPGVATLDANQSWNLYRQIPNANFLGQSSLNAKFQGDFSRFAWGEFNLPPEFDGKILLRFFTSIDGKITSPAVANIGVRLFATAQDRIQYRDEIAGDRAFDLAVTTSSGKFASGTLQTTSNCFGIFNIWSTSPPSAGLIRAHLALVLTTD